MDAGGETMPRVRLVCQHRAPCRNVLFLDPFSTPRVQATTFSHVQMPGDVRILELGQERIGLGDLTRISGPADGSCYATPFIVSDLNPATSRATTLCANMDRVRVDGAFRLLSETSTRLDDVRVRKTRIDTNGAALFALSATSGRVLRVALSSRPAVCSSVELIDLAPGGDDAAASSPFEQSVVCSPCGRYVAVSGRTFLYVLCAETLAVLSQTCALWPYDPAGHNFTGCAAWVSGCICFFSEMQNKIVVCDPTTLELRAELPLHVALRNIEYSVAPDLRHVVVRDTAPPKRIGDGAPDNKLLVFELQPYDIRGRRQRSEPGVLVSIIHDPAPCVTLKSPQFLANSVTIAALDASIGGISLFSAATGHRLHGVRAEGISTLGRLRALAYDSAQRTQMLSVSSTDAGRYCLFAVDLV